MTSASEVSSASASGRGAGISELVSECSGSETGKTELTKSGSEAGTIGTAQLVIIEQVWF